MSGVVPSQFITMNKEVTERYGHLLNPRLYFYQKDGMMNQLWEWWNDESAMGIQYFQVKFTILLSPFEAIVDYHPNDTRVFEFWLNQFSGQKPVQLDGDVLSIPVKCQRLDTSIPFSHSRM